MNAFEINKIIGAILATALIAFLISLVGNVLVPEGGGGEGKHAPAVATAAGAGSAAVTKAPPKPEIPLANLLAQGSIEAGKKVAKKCLACHSLKKGGANKIGPNLYDVVGRKKGAHPGFNYSGGMKGAGGIWSYADLNSFLKKPGAFVKGTKMSFRIAKAKARANLLLFLRTLSDSPEALPKPVAAPKEKKAEAVKKTMAETKPPEDKKPGEAPKQMAKKEVTPLAAGDAARGAKLAAIKCKVCHSLKSGGPNKIGPNLYGVVGRARASHQGYRYSKAMKAKGGSWSPEEIAIFLTNPGKFIKGTNMTVKIKRPNQRADIIAYLKTLK